MAKLSIAYSKDHCAIEHSEYGEIGRTSDANKVHAFEEIAARFSETDALRAENARLREALKVLADIPVEQFGKENKPDYPLMGWNEHILLVRHVLQARAALKGDK